MPWTDYLCSSCGAEQTVVYSATDVDSINWPPRCAACAEPLTEYASCPAPAVDAKEPFSRFSVHRQVPTRDGLMQVEETIDSVHKLRQLEKDSEQRYRDGEGEPLRFRVYNQDASNMDVNSFGTEGSIGGRSYDSGKAPTPPRKNLGVVRHGQQRPEVSIGPGLRNAVSPLKG